MKHSKRKLTTLLCIIPLLLACSTQYQGEKAKDPKQSAEKQAIVEEPVIVSIDVPVGEDPGLFLYENPMTRLDVVDFYNSVTGDAVVTRAILQNAAKYGVPLSLAFALAHGESDFNRWAVNKNASSVDRGLFQLNSTTFPQLTESQCFDPTINSRYAMRHFRWCLDQGGNKVVGIAIYNAGRGRVEIGGTPRVTLDHINNIIQYQVELDRLFLGWMDNLQTVRVCFHSAEPPGNSG